MEYGWRLPSKGRDMQAGDGEGKSRITRVERGNCGALLRNDEVGKIVGSDDNDRETSESSCQCLDSE